MRRRGDKLKTCFTWWKKAYTEGRGKDAAAGTDKTQQQWMHRLHQWINSYGKRIEYKDKVAPSQDLLKEQVAKLKKQQEEDEADRWKEYERDEEEEEEDKAP